MLYEFKINLEPAILKLYAGNGQNHDLGMHQIKQELLPSLFKKVFPKTRGIKDHWLVINSNDSVNILDTEVYKEFKFASQTLIENYFSVVSEYISTQSIQYSSEFLNIVKPKAKESIDNLLNSFPEINLAFDTPNKKFSDDLNKDVGHGRMYIVNSRKIEEYLIQNPKSVNLLAYYNLHNERILVEASDEEGAKAVALTLVKMLNSKSEKMSLGAININPIFESYKIEESYRKVHFHFVYPNGIPYEESEDAFDRYYKHKQIEQINYAKLDIVVTASEKNNFSAEDIESVGKEDAKHGYLQGITNGTKKIMKAFITKYKNIDEADENEEKMDRRE
ncbi:hypothetical protein GHU05_01630 [Fructobacillus tropaeoli]|uniref:hypothetical protein n=1 Tax=Fructobacillus tropaeoli TaxID=709323 RepID=UPI001455FF31|nr:hypothetical protein [Fructobacillus tropaeoli]NLS37633.1 hypothetical protein [Fructobacillus tropaeoli]